jgi:hypothetical protein
MSFSSAGGRIAAYLDSPVMREARVAENARLATDHSAPPM